VVTKPLVVRAGASSLCRNARMISGSGLLSCKNAKADGMRRDGYVGFGAAWSSSAAFNLGEKAMVAAATLSAPVSPSSMNIKLMANSCRDMATTPGESAAALRKTRFITRLVKLRSPEQVIACTDAQWRFLAGKRACKWSYCGGCVLCVRGLDGGPFCECCAWRPECPCRTNRFDSTPEIRRQSRYRVEHSRAAAP
jgi:hypothetical protein